MAKKKIGVTLDTALHAAVKSAAPLRGLNVEKAYDSALRTWLGKPDQTASFTDRWHQMLAEILASGDQEAISAVQQNILVFHRIVGAGGAGEKRSKKGA